jgi:hypothetical protein
MAFERKALAFYPDAVLYIAHSNDLVVRHMVDKFLEKVDFPYAFMDDIARRAEISQTMEAAEIRRRLQNFAPELVKDIYSRFVQVAREHGIEPIWTWLPSVDDGNTGDESKTELMEIARAAGFQIIDLSGVYAGQDAATLWITEWDHHPNQKGHALIADALLTRLYSLEPFKAVVAARQGEKQ